VDEPKANNDIPNRASNMAQAEGDRWESDPSTVERQDRDRPETGASADPSRTGSSKQSDGLRKQSDRLRKQTDNDERQDR
jgi:hypothetical protein